MPVFGILRFRRKVWCGPGFGSMLTRQANWERHAMREGSSKCIHHDDDTLMMMMMIMMMMTIIIIMMMMMIVIYTHDL